MLMIIAPIRTGFWGTLQVCDCVVCEETCRASQGLKETLLGGKQSFKASCNLCEAASLSLYADIDAYQIQNTHHTGVYVHMLNTTVCAIYIHTDIHA